MANGKQTMHREFSAKQPAQRASLAPVGEPLRESGVPPPPEPVSGLVPRHRPGRGQEVSPSEARTIQLAKLTGPTISQDELCRRFGRSRDTIRRVLHDPSFEQLKAEFDGTMAAEARGVLDSGRTAAAQAWLASLDRAASRGDHRPSRDLLYVTRTCEPPSALGSGPATVVHIGRVINMAVPGCGFRKFWALNSGKSDHFVPAI